MEGIQTGIRKAAVYGAQKSDVRVGFISDSHQLVDEMNRIGKMFQAKPREMMEGKKG